MNFLKRVWESFKYRFVHSTFDFWQALGFHVLRNHYYEPVPDTSTLPSTLWEKPSETIGLRWNDEAQRAALARWSDRYKAEYGQFPSRPTGSAPQYYLQNGYFENVDAEVLYCLIRERKPRRIYEIGSGFSTLISAQAIGKNQDEQPGYQCDLVAIEPFPRQELRQGFPHLTRLIAKPVQAVPMEMFLELGESDILFIDSSHVAKIGSDVNYEFLEIFPRLKKGTAVHIHDIFIPWDYPRKVIVDSHNFFNEQYLLQAFLALNDSFEILWGGSYMHHEHPNLLKDAFPAYAREPHCPGSFWIQRVR